MFTLVYFYFYCSITYVQLCRVISGIRISIEFSAVLNRLCVYVGTSYDDVRTCTYASNTLKMNILFYRSVFGMPRQLSVLKTDYKRARRAMCYNKTKDDDCKSRILRLVYFIFLAIRCRNPPWPPPLCC